MGMTVNVLRISSDELESFLKRSELLEQKVNKIFQEGFQNNPSLMDVDRAFDGIIFLLTGKSMVTGDPKQDELLQVFFSMQIVDEFQDLGLGPGHYLKPNQVAKLSQKLSEVDVKDLEARFDPKKMAEKEVYPGFSDSPEDLEYLKGYFLKLQDFYEIAAKNQEAIITFLT